MQKRICTLLIVMTSLTMSGQMQQSYSLNIEKSTLHWKGTYSFLFSEHHGTVSFKEGSLLTQNSNIVGGSFIIDMNSITNEDYEYNQGPVKHLKDKDFFDVPTFSEAKLVITKVSYYAEENRHKMEANLTIKNKTQPIEFWATVDAEQKVLITRFKIDRRRWGITYNNELKNHAIADAIEFEAELFF